MQKVATCGHFNQGLNRKDETDKIISCVSWCRRSQASTRQSPFTVWRNRRDS